MSIQKADITGFAVKYRKITTPGILETVDDPIRCVPTDSIGFRKHDRPGRNPDLRSWCEIWHICTNRNCISSFDIYGSSFDSYACRADSDFSGETTGIGVSGEPRNSAFFKQLKPGILVAGDWRAHQSSSIGIHILDLEEASCFSRETHSVLYALARA